jgi:hypothetical protein
MRLWFNGGTQDIAVVAEQVMKGLCSLVAGADG